MKNARQHIAFACLLLAAIMTVFSCGGPTVKHSSISGEIRTVEHWNLVWAGQDQTDAASSPASRASQAWRSHEGYCAEFVEDIRTELTDKYGYAFGENFPVTGTITIELHGGTLSDYVPETDTTNLYGDISPADDRYGRSEFDVATAAVTLFSGRDRVRQVRLVILDTDGKNLGEVIIGDEPSDHVKPNYVAKVLDEILRTGKYGKGEGVSVQVGERL